jgi:RNA polymerase sigma factor (sigma-70 family)
MSTDELRRSEMKANDMELLRQYARQGSEQAFGELVSRHVSLVYSVALRQVRDPHLAEEITQAVFIILARKAKSLGDKTILPGWLCRTARNVAANALTIQRRRQHREQEACMETIVNGGCDASSQPIAEETWRQIAPLLDTALGRLAAKDHDAIVLRFFEKKNFAEVGTALGASEDAAKKRVSRALEKLRRFFLKRGVDSTAATIAETISTNSVQAAPVALAKSVTAVAIVKGSIAAASTLTLVKGIMKTMAWSKIKIATAISAGVILLASVSTLIVAQTKSADTNTTNYIATDDTLLITPHVSVGKVKSGMTEDEVIAALGQPERKQGEVLIYDTQLGLSVVCSQQKIVGAVFCGGPVDFRGRTKEGIGIGSSQSDLIKAYHGQPANWAKQPDQDSVDYPSLGLNFTLRNGKVYNIVVNLRKPR